MSFGDRRLDASLDAWLTTDPRDAQDSIDSAQAEVRLALQNFIDCYESDAPDSAQHALSYASELAEAVKAWLFEIETDGEFQ